MGGLGEDVDLGDLLFRGEERLCEESNLLSDMRWDGRPPVTTTIVFRIISYMSFGTS